MKKHWSTQDIPAQNGKTYIVTGAGGLGYETALALAAHGADVVIAGRNPGKGAEALARIRQAHPTAKVRFGQLDLAKLASVQSFAAWAAQELPALDGLINNAGVMALPTRQVTADGFEMQLGTNYLGHFALTAHLLPLLQRRPRARVVNLSSGMERAGKFDFSDLQLEKGYTPTRAYGNSKLAMLMFSIELQRRSAQQGWGISAFAAHPGYARTDLMANGPGADALSSRLSRWLLAPWASQSAAAGALPTLYAATDAGAEGGAYYGPRFGLVGPPALAGTSRAAHDAGATRQLWELSERLTHVTLAPSAGAQRLGE